MGDKGGWEPEQLREGLICKFYGCLPSALDGEDMGRVLQDMSAVNLYELAVGWNNSKQAGPPPASVAEAIMLEAEMMKNGEST